MGLLPASARGADKPPVPQLPIAAQWSKDLDAGVTAAPLLDADRVYLAHSTGHVAARSLADGREIWRTAKTITAPMIAAGGRLFLSSGDAVEALRGGDGASAWIAPRLQAVAPLVTVGDLLAVVTESEVVALRVSDGSVAWRHPAGGVRLAPAFDGEHLIVGADDGRVLALKAATGEPAWERFVPKGVTALAARKGLVYVGAGDKQVHCLDGHDRGDKWTFRVGAIPLKLMAVDDDHVYFTALDNVVRALDRDSGNQQWQAALKKRPVGGVQSAGGVVFVQVSGELALLLERDGRAAGAIALPGETTRDVPPAVRESEHGIAALVVTGSLTNKWQLTSIGPAPDVPLEAFSSLTAMPGVAFLTDPVLVPIARALPWLVLGDPILKPFAAIEWPIVLRDPPLEPLTALPGLQLRALSPVLPVRRGG